MSATDIAAWIGALTGTLVLIWDVYKWMQTGPKVKVSVAPNMVAYGSAVASNPGSDRDSSNECGENIMKERFVLFLDVLGFSQLVSNNTPDDLRKIYDTEFHKTAAATAAFAGPMFGRMPNFSVRAHGNILQDVKQDGLNFHVMSDTLIAWTNDDTFEALVHLAQFTAAYLSMTLTLGLPHRGAISKGSIQLIELPLNGKPQANVVGTGVVNAHNFEAGQEWMGCAVDPGCLEGFETNHRADFPVVEYNIPYGDKPKHRSTVAIDWARCLTQLQPNADPEFFRNQFNRHNKRAEAAEKKIINTAAFFAAMKPPGANAT